MKQITVKVEDKLADAIERRVEKLNSWQSQPRWTRSDVVRQALESLLLPEEKGGEA